MAVFACYKNLSGRPTGLEPAPTPEPQSGALPIKLRSPNVPPPGLEPGHRA